MCVVLLARALLCLCLGHVSENALCLLHISANCTVIVGEVTVLAFFKCFKDA